MMLNFQIRLLIILNRSTNLITFLMMVKVREIKMKMLTLMIRPKLKKSIVIVFKFSKKGGAKSNLELEQNSFEQESC